MCTSRGQEGVGGPHHRADVEVVLPVLDRDVERVPAGVEVGDDRVEPPVAVAVDDVAPVAVREQLGVEVRRRSGHVRPRHGPTPDLGAAVRRSRLVGHASAALVRLRESAVAGAVTRIVGFDGGFGRRYARRVLADLQNPALLGGLLDPQAWIDQFGAYALWGVGAHRVHRVLAVPVPAGRLAAVHWSGLLISQNEQVGQPIWLACLVLTVAAVLEQRRRLPGRAAVGPALFNRPDSRFFKQEYIDKTLAFFDRYGNRAIVLARFVPIVRTFITLAAGVGGMPMRRFVTYSAIGGVLWATGVTLLGLLPRQVDFVGDHIDADAVAIVAVSLVPVVIEVLRARSGSRDERYDDPPSAPRCCARSPTTSPRPDAAGSSVAESAPRDRSRAGTRGSARPRRARRSAPTRRPARPDTAGSPGSARGSTGSGRGPSSRCVAARRVRGGSRPGRTRSRPGRRRRPGRASATVAHASDEAGYAPRDVGGRRTRRQHGRGRVGGSRVGGGPPSRLSKLMEPSCRRDNSAVLLRRWLWTATKTW